MRSWLSIIVCLAGLWAGVGIARAADDPPSLMARIARDLDLQTKMPVEEPEKPNERHWSSLRWHIPANIAEWILWGALAAGLAFAVYALRDSIPGVSRRTKVRPRHSAVILTGADSVERMSEAGEDADDLARRGLFAEAMHMLLLRSVAELRQRLEATIADSLTSREILQRLTLPETGRRAFADLIGRVELVHFGTRAAASSDYEACRTSFRTLIAAMRPAAA